MVLQVVGAGFGRTGTASTKAALETLLGRPCYHMFEALAHLDHQPAWLASAAGDTSALRPVLDGYGATVDWPACSLWRELMDLYPDAKVLLTVRPAEVWWDSYSHTIHELMLQPIPDPDEVGQDLADLSVFGHTLPKRSFPTPYHSLDRADFVEAYENHNAAVRSRGTSATPSPRVADPPPPVEERRSRVTRPAPQVVEVRAQQGRDPPVEQ